MSNIEIMSNIDRASLKIGQRWRLYNSKQIVEIKSFGLDSQLKNVLAQDIYGILKGNIDFYYFYTYYWFLLKGQEAPNETG